MSKILSICIPSYNMEQYLHRCISSLAIDEVLSDIEIIIVNDGSKDKTLEIALYYQGLYPQSVKVIDKKNGNYGSCINAALKVSSGYYFRICDADDRYETDNLCGYIKFLKSTDADIVFTPYKTVDFNSNVVKEFNVPEKYRTGKFLIDEINWSKCELREFRAMHCMATKTKLLIDNNYYQTEGISYTDTQFVFYSDLYAQNIGFYNDTIYCYYLGRDGQTMSIQSMLKSYQHFYINAERMLKDFINIHSTLSSNKKNLMLRSIIVELSLYIDVVLGYIYNSKANIDLFKNLMLRANNANIASMIEEQLLCNRKYYLWRKCGVPAKLIYLITKLKMIMK